MHEPEWGFTEPPERVDLERIWWELFRAPAIYQFSYVSELRRKAPVTYERLRAWASERGVGMGINWLPSSANGDELSTNDPA